MRQLTANDAEWEVKVTRLLNTGERAILVRGFLPDWRISAVEVLASPDEDTDPGVEAQIREIVWNRLHEIFWTKLNRGDYGVCG